MTQIEYLKNNLIDSFEQIGYTKEQASTMVNAIFGKLT